MKADTGVYQFDEIVINPADFQALRAGVRLEIEPKSFKVLMYLIENRERVVSKDEIAFRIFERGVGPTTSSGTGTCASSAAAMAVRGTARELTSVGTTGASCTCL